MRKSASILLSIGILVILIGVVIGCVYILTGNTIQLGDKNYFVGHILNSNGTINAEKMTEKLSLISFGVGVLGILLATVGLVLFRKGKTKAEANEFMKKRFSIGTIGVTIIFISLIAILPLTPRSSWRIQNNQFKTAIWYYLMLIIFIIGAITNITGVIQAFRASKMPMIKDKTKASINKDDF